MNASSTPALPDPLALHEAAAQWLVRRQDASWSAEDERELDAWLAAEPAHRHAFEQVSRTWQDLSQVPRPALASDAQSLRDRRNPPQASAPPASRRGPARPGIWQTLLGQPVFAKACAVVCATVVLGGGYAWYRWDNTPDYVLNVATAAGETRQVDLPDGSHVSLNISSTLQVRYYPRRRELVLNQGEGYFDVAPDAGRPFTVDARDSRITVVGTVFNVRNAPDEVIVKVLHGRVRVQPDRTHAGAEVMLTREEGVAVDTRKATYHPVAAVPDSVGGWRTGRLVYRRTPLGEVAQEISQYVGKPVELDSPSLKSLPVSGFATTSAPAPFLEALPDLLPVQVRRTADGGYLIVGR